MRKIFIVITAILLAGSSFAQNESKLHFGLKAAPSLAWFRTDTKGLNSDGSKFGFSYGLITEFNFADNYAFVTGIDIAYRGGKFKQDTNIGDTIITRTNASYTLQYVEVPITLKFKTNEIGYLTYYLQAGVAPAINIRARQAFETETQQGSVITTTEGSGIDIQENINNFNLSMIIGGGVEYTLSGSTVLLLGVQFNNGFLDVFDDDSKVNSNFLALTVGVLF
jgi:hypothetical protein